MATIKMLQRIAETLQDAELAWLLPNLRQDAVIWNALNEAGFYEKLIQSKPAAEAFAPADFNPARLALLAAGQLLPTNAERVTWIDAIDAQVIQMAARSFNDQTIFTTGPQDLPAAGMIALAMLDMFRASHSWNGLLNVIPERPGEAWSAPVTCLMGFLEEPLELLRALVQPGVAPIRYRLAVHGVLSNPIQPADQLDLLLSVCQSEYGDLLPAADRLRLVHELSEQRPQMAVDFCTKWLEMHPNNSAESSLEKDHPGGMIDQLAESMFQVEVREIAGCTQDLASTIAVENKLNLSLYTQLTTRTAAQKSRSMNGKATPKLAELFEKMTQLPELTESEGIDPLLQAEMALTLADQGYFEQAAELLPCSTEPHMQEAGLLYAMGQIAFQAGNHARATWAAGRIAELTLKDASMPVWGKFYSLVNLGNLLLNLGKPSQAVEVFERAAQTCPADENLLKLLADSYTAAQQYEQAVDTWQVLVSLNPGDLDNRRAYALSLANLGDWEACLAQRSIIIGADRGEAKSHPKQDLYAYAHSALKAHHPQLTLNACDELLTDNPEDSQALMYAGEAHLQMNQTDQGLEFLRRATQAAPDKAETWLALAAAQKAIYPAETVIETLRNAIQAVPGSGQIHFALGDLYLQDNAPTLAMPELQAALELAPVDVQILVSNGRCLRELGHAEAAREVFSKAFSLSPKYAGLAQMYASLLIELGELEAALPPLEVMLETKPVNGLSAYLDYARCVLTLHQQGSSRYSPMKALIALNEILQVDPEHAEAKALTAEALAANGEKEMAFQAYREALDTALTEDKVWFERLSFGFGSVASSIGKHDIAIAALQEASQTNPDNPEICMALSDAYYSANLPEDAVRSARNVLVIDGDDPDKLAWFARQAAKFIQDQKPDSSNQALSLAKELPREALNALNQAIQLAPTRTDLLLQLGSLHASIGDGDAAKVIFASISSLDFATIEDLKSAAQYLSAIGDHVSAIECLEKGISLDQQSMEMHTASLYISMAQEYVNNHDHTSAINTLDKAISIIPDESSLISLKIDILLGLGQSLDALHCIETVLQQPGLSLASIDFLFLAARINRTIGDFGAALKYARRGLEAAHKPGITHQKSQLAYPHRAQVAELYRAVLQPEQAYKLVRDEIDPATFESSIGQDYLDYVCIQAELALETGDQISPALQDVRLDASHPSFSRLTAIKARLLHKAGNYKQALQLFQSAFGKSAEPEPSSHQADWSAPYIKYLNTISINETAQDLGLWEQAQTGAKQLDELTSGEPLPELLLARTQVLKAEYTRQCELFEASTHAPARDGLFDDAYKSCRQQLDLARSTLETHQDGQTSAEPGITFDQVYRWQARAAIVFERPDDLAPDACEILAQQLTYDDSVSLISHLHQMSLLDPDSDALTRIIKLARSHPRNPAVMLQVALALQDNNPANAMKSLQAVLQQNPFARNPTTAFCNILLARLGLTYDDFEVARQAVESAIEFWPDEASWHALAARIYAHSHAISEATSHLLEATRLAPKDIAYHMDLGKLYFENASGDPRILSQAMNSYENAAALDQENVTARVQLATTQCLMNDLDKAEVNARSALMLSPNQADIYQLLSEISIRNNDFQGAYEYANKAILINPKDIQFTVSLAKSLSALGRHEDALAKLTAVIPAAPEAKWLHLERVDILRKMNGARAALRELIALTGPYPQDFNILNALAKAYLEVGETENAVTIAQQALTVCDEKTSHNEQANLHLYIGQALRLSGQLDSSILHLSEAIQLAPDRLEPYLELGLARKEQREYQQAIQVFERATVIAPNDPRAPFQAGLALKESKDYKSSETMLRRAVSLAPNDLTIRRQLAAVVALNLVHNPRSGRNYAK